MGRVKPAFNTLIRTISIDCIRTQKEVIYDHRRVLFYKQIEASIADIGLIEPLVVYQEKQSEYLLLDGHFRLDVLKRKGVKQVDCIISSDDESYTYNRRVNTIPPIAQHLMLLKALENGLSEERIAASLRVDVASIRRKSNMLDGICSEAVAILQIHKVSARSFGILRKMKPLRQIEAAEHMVANMVFGSGFARAILYATKTELLVTPPKASKKSALSDSTKDIFANESQALLKDLKILETDLGKHSLKLTVYSGYLKRLLRNKRVRGYLDRRHEEIVKVLRSGLEDST